MHRAVFAAFVSVTACSALVDSSDLTNVPPTTSEDATTTDASAGHTVIEIADTGTTIAEASIADASTADTSITDAGGGDASTCVNLVLNPGFETKASCDPWRTLGGAIAPSSVARTGTRACEICADDAGNFVGWTPLTGTTFYGGERLRFTGWARASDTGLYALPIIPTLTATSDLAIQHGSILSDQYQLISAELEYPTDGGPYPDPSISLIGGGPAGACFLLDDVEICRISADGG
jgi:hypothetical protein